MEKQGSIKPTLLVLAAGMGSRYGGLKQMDAFGPNGEAIIDYSIYDAIHAGFDEVVFIVREHFLEDFKKAFDEKLQGRIRVKYVTQELNKLPEGLTFPESRQKPWGTAHAVYVAEHAVDKAFAVINADDFYGRDAFTTMASFLSDPHNPNYCIVGYYLKNTLSEHGHVNRGVCRVSPEGHLLDITECTKISRAENGEVSYPDDAGQLQILPEDAVVSMNMIGMKTSYFDYCRALLKDFIIQRGHEEKSELYIPKVLDHLIENEALAIDVLNTTSNWFGVTYPEDKPQVIAQLNNLINSGEYPKQLWG